MSGEQELKFLDEIEHVQTRPGMYVGDVSNPRTLVRELIDNALDEYINGHANRITIFCDSESYTIIDDGRGLPLFEVPELENQRAAKLLFLKLFSGGKFNHTNYKFSAGLHGVGLTVVNALSEYVDVLVKEGDTIYTLRLENGEDIREDVSVTKGKEWWSTSISCKPSLTYFKSDKTVIDTLPLQLAKSMRPEGRISVNDEEIQQFDFRNNIDSAFLENEYYIYTFKNDNIIFEVFFGWSDTEINYMSKGTCNLVPCSTGWHERRAKAAIGNALSNIIDMLGPEDANYGLRLFVNLFTQEPTFTSQSKDRLSSIRDEPDGFTSTITTGIERTFEKKPDLLEAVAKKIVNHKKKLEKLSDSEVIEAVVRTGNDKRRGKGVGVGIWECSTSDRSKAELYIVEGKSAAGHVRTTRNQSTQAVLPLRGKPLNAVVADDIKSILDNEEMVSLVNCIGAGVAPKVDMSGLRYGKILIAADADADGAQIANLIIGALIYLIPELVEGGHVYEVLAPLYEQNGEYFYDLKEVNTKKDFERFKGLGSMNPDKVEKTIISPTTRRLRQVKLDDRDRVLSILQSSFEKKRIMLKGGVIIEE